MSPRAGPRSEPWSRHSTTCPRAAAPWPSVSPGRRSPSPSARRRRSRRFTEMTPQDPERTRVLKLLQAHGWNATSFQILEPGFRYWFEGEEACVGYVDVGKGWVVAGAPITARERLRPVTESFLAAARAAGKRVTCFATEARFHEAVPGWHALRIGDQPVWDPHEWNATLERSRSLREQLRRARAKGVAVRS